MPASIYGIEFNAGDLSLVLCVIFAVAIIFYTAFPEMIVSAAWKAVLMATPPPFPSEIGL